MMQSEFSLKKEWGSYDRLLESDSLRINLIKVPAKSQTDKKQSEGIRHFIIASGCDHCHIIILKPYGHQNYHIAKKDEHIYAEHEDQYMFLNDSYDELIVLEIRNMEE